MSLRRGCFGRSLHPLFVMAIVALASATALAQQETPAPTTEIFAGYSWIDPGGKPNSIGSIPWGWGITSTINFNRSFGLDLDSSGHLAGSSDKANMATFGVGPKLAFRSETFTPFVHALFGVNRLSVTGLGSHNMFGVMLGGGLDVNVNRWLALRLIQADYVMTRPNRDADEIPLRGFFGSPLNGERLESGIVLKLGGGPPPPPPSASCSVQPSEVMAGEPVTVTATTSGFNPKHPPTFSWSSTGGKVSGNQTSTTVDTNGLAPGSYTVTANATGIKNATATCNANFTVKQPPPPPNPVMSCSANPTTVQAGTPSTITCECRTGDGQGTATVSNWSATGGRLSGSGNTATLDTAGAASGPITVSATCSDSRGPTANGSAQVTVENPPPPPQSSAMCSITFPNKRKPARVDNTAKACLDDVALRLQREADAKAVVIGNQDPKEKGKNLAADRAINTKEYLTKEKGIDPGRISLMTGTSGEAKVDNVLVPPGAQFTQAGTTPVTETAPKARPRRKAAPKKKAAAAAPAAKQ